MTSKFNSDNEFIFWKVIHNIHLFRLLFKKIDEYDIYQKEAMHYKMGNKIKFKYLNSLSSLVIKQQWSLLKYYLKSNIEIHINNNMVDIFLSCYKSGYIGDIETDNELFQLIYEKVEKELPLYDLIINSIKEQNNHAVEVFVELRSKINVHTINELIKFGNIGLLEKVIAKSGPSSIIPINYPLVNIQKNHDLVKYLILENILEISNEYNHDDKIDFSNFIDYPCVDSKDIIVNNKLLNLNLIKQPYSHEVIKFMEWFINVEQEYTSEYIKFVISVYFKFFKPLPSTIPIEIEQESSLYKLKLFLINVIELADTQLLSFNKFIYQFLMEYKNLNGITNLESIFYYSISTFNLDSLKLIINGEYYSKKKVSFDYFSIDINHLNQMENRESVIEFINFIFSNGTPESILFSNDIILWVSEIFKNCNDFIDVIYPRIKESNLFFKILFTKCYCFQTISLDKFKWFINYSKYKKNFKRNNYYFNLNYSLEKEKQQVIDYIKEKWEFFKDNVSLFSHDILSNLLSTRELIIYFLEVVVNFQESEIDNKSIQFLKNHFYVTIVSWSIYHCDVDVLLQLISISKKNDIPIYNQRIDSMSFEKLKEISPTTEQVYVLIEFINDHFQLFNDQFLNLFSTFSKLYPNATLKINYHLFKDQVVNIFRYSITTCNFQTVQYIIENDFLQFDSIEPPIKFILNMDSSGYIKKLSKFNTSIAIGDPTPHDILQLLKLLFKSIPKHCLIVFIKHLKKLFKYIISSENVTSNQINEAIELFENCKMVDNINLKYTSISIILYYINFRSTKLFKLILNISNGSVYKLSGFYNVSEFCNFNEILNSSWDQLLFKICDGLFIESQKFKKVEIKFQIINTLLQVNEISTLLKYKNQLVIQSSCQIPEGYVKKLYSKLLSFADFDIVQLVLELIDPGKLLLFQLSIKKTRVDILEWLFGSNDFIGTIQENDLSNAIESACLVNNYKVVEFILYNCNLHHQSFEPTKEVLDNTYSKGYFKMYNLLKSFK